MKQKPEWKKLIDSVHKKHLEYIQPDGVDGLAFHYTSPSGLLGIISNSSIWFSDSDYLNDASESDYFHEIASSIFSTNKKDTIESNLAFRSYLMSMFHCNYNGQGRKSISREKERRYVLSLSVDRDSLSLWNYYTKTIDSTGYNIGLNLEKLTESIMLSPNQTLLVGRVIYSRDLQEALLRELYNDYIDIYKQYKNTYQRKYLYEMLEDNIVKYSVFMKDPSFSSESELRITIFEKGNSQEKKSYREKNGAFLPYITKGININSISEVMVSPTTKADFVKNSVMDLLNNYGIKDAIVEQSVIPIRY